MRRPTPSSSDRPPYRDFGVQPTSTIRGGAPRWLPCLALLWLAQPAMGDEAGLQALLSCRPEAAPGRVLCQLQYSAPAGASLAWADALVTGAPDFVRPLRSRIASERFSGASTTVRTLNLALVAGANGVGHISVRARAVLCRGQGARQSCRPESRELQAEIRVGS